MSVRVATDFLEWLSKNGGKGLMRDPKTGRMMPRPSAAEGAAEGPNFGGQYSVKGGEGMVRPSGAAEGPNFGGAYTARGETLASQRAPSTELVPVRPEVRPDPNFTMVKPPSTAVAPRSSTDVARFLEEANAAKAASNASLSKVFPAAIMGGGAAALSAGAGLYDDFGRPIGPVQGETVDMPPNYGTETWGASQQVPLSRPTAPAPVPAAVQVATRAVTPQRDVPLPPPRPAELHPGMMDRVFNGGNYQSNGRLVSTPTDGAPINWGDSDRASDFVRADKQAQLEGDYARGGMASAHEQALHKAMHVIHHLLSRGGRA